MKTIATILSTAAIGFIVGSPSLSLLHELQHFMRHKRRLLWALVFSAAAFVFMMSGMLFGAFEAAIQYDDQGFLIWSSIFTLSSALIIAAAVCAIIGKLVSPGLPEPGLFAGQAHARLQSVIEEFIGEFLETRKPRPDSQRRSGPDRSEVADYGHPEYTTH